MSITSILWKNSDKIIQSFHISIIFGLLETWKRTNILNTVPQEPDFVASLTLDTTPLIYSVLKKILLEEQINVSISSVFCHQTPKVMFDTNHKSKCEIGDILFVYVHTTKKGETRRNAILFQAKSSSKQPYRIHSSDSHQLNLYINWPDFIYISPYFLKGKKRNVFPKSPHSGAQYLLIDNRSPNEPLSGLLGFPGTYPIGCCIPDKFLWDHNNLASELFNLLIFKTGRPFGERTSSLKSGGWSQIIWVLLEIGLKKSFNRKVSGRHNSPRTIGDNVKNWDGISFNDTTSTISCSMVKKIIGYDKSRYFYGKGGDEIPPFREENIDYFNVEEGGVSVILIETNESEFKD